MFSSRQAAKLNKLWTKKEESESKRKKKNPDDVLFPTKRPKFIKLEVKPQETPQERSAKLGELSRDKIALSQFRQLNEFLYSHSSWEAKKHVDENMFRNYHAAYMRLVDKWPVKPIDAIIELMDKFYEHKGRGQVFADMGCGNKPMIAEHFTKATVHSFDLFSEHEKIQQSCMTLVPLDSNSCHCLVYSLSLMNTNLVDVLKEASRILKPGGHLIIAEVTSRFHNESSKDGDAKAECDSIASFNSKLFKYFNLKNKRIEYLKPNDYFVILDFIKKKDVSKDGVVKKKSDIPAIKLNPCLYKPR